MKMMHIEDRNIWQKNGHFVVESPFLAEISIDELEDKLDTAIKKYNPGDSGVSYSILVRTDYRDDVCKISPLFRTAKSILSRMEYYEYAGLEKTKIEYSKEQITKKEAMKEGILIVYLVNMDSCETMLMLKIELNTGKIIVNSMQLDIDEDNARELLRVVRRIRNADVESFFN